MTDEVKKLKQIIEESDNIVFLGGAGVSTESNIPDFRSENGLFKAKKEYGYSPEVLLSHSFFEKHTKTFYDYYRNNLLYLDAQPNKAHLALAKLEKAGSLKAVVTQNIDGLHQKAGSKTVYELHGSVLRNYCMKCGNFYSAEYIKNSEGIPKCSCGGTIKPDVVLYEEGLDNYVWDSAYKAITRADVLIVGGTSLVVYPAAGLVSVYKGKKLVLINKSKTQYDRYANLIINDSIGTVLDDAVSGIEI